MHPMNRYKNLYPYSIFYKIWIKLDMTPNFNVTGPCACRDFLPSIYGTRTKPTCLSNETGP